VLKQPSRSIKGIEDSAFRVKTVKCTKRSNLGTRIEVGVSKYNYNNKTEQWLGNHLGPNFNLIFTINKFNLGIRFKPATVNTKTNLVFTNDTLPIYSKLNPIKLDYYLGYSFDFTHNISIEPYIGYSHTRFTIINENELKNKLSIPDVNGFISGVTGNKYFKLKGHNYVAIFASLGYAFVNYNNVNENLDRGYFELTIGIAYKGFLERQFLREVE